MSAFDTKQTLLIVRRMTAFGGKDRHANSKMFMSAFDQSGHATPRDQSRFALSSGLRRERQLY
jgi:hypothetical protein